jgi:hypothetical protein
MASDKPTLRPKRDKKVVENNEFDAFARRIVRAYARRVADGDIEALVALRRLASEVDNATAAAVQGLREFGYSWSEIAARLGVTRQGAQMRWANRADRGRIDERILNAGIAVTVAQLVAVFIDHHPGTPAATTCPACAFEYPQGITNCPTNRVVRPLLYARRHEDQKAVRRLSRDQLVDLCDRRVTRANRAAERTVSAHPSLDGAMSLLDLLEGSS